MKYVILFGIIAVVIVVLGVLTDAAEQMEE